MPSITTALKLDDKDLRSKLESANKYIKETYGDWIDATQELTDIDKRLVSEKEKLAKATKSESQAIKENIKQLQLEKNAIRAKQTASKTEHTTLKQLTTELNKNTLAKKANTKSTKDLSKNTGQFTNTVVRHLRQIETLVVAYYTLSRGIDVTVGKGIQVNRMMEDNTAGISALLSANTRMVLTNGEVVNSYEKFNMGGKIAAETMDDLRKASVRTFASFPQLTEIFQQAIGQTLSMGDSFGKTTDEIIGNTIKLSQRMSNIGGAIGQPMDRIREEIRSLLSGNASTDSLIATMIFGSPGEANKAIRMAKERGDRGVKELLDTMLAPFDALENVNTFTRSLLTFEDAWANTMRRVVSETGLYKDIQDIIDTSAKSINENQDSIVDSLDNIYTAMKKVGEFSGDFATALAAPIGALASLREEAKRFSGTGERIVKKDADELQKLVKETKDRLSDAKAVLAREQAELATLEAVPEGQRSPLDPRIAINRFQVESAKRQVQELEPILNRYERRLKQLSGEASFEKTASEIEKELDEQEAKAKVNETRRIGALQQRLSLNKKLFEDAEKLIERNDKLLELEKERNKFKRGIEVDSKKLLAEENQDQESQNLILNHRKTLQEALLSINKQISEEKDKQAKQENQSIERARREVEKAQQLKEQTLYGTTNVEKVNRQFAQRGRRLSGLTGSLGMSENDWQIFAQRYEAALSQAEAKDKLSQDKIIKYKFETLETYSDAIKLVNQEISESELNNAQKTVEVYRTLNTSLKSAMQDFFDFNSEGFAEMGKLANNVLNSILNKMIQMAIINPLASAATTGLSGFIGGLFENGGMVGQPTTIKKYATGGMIESGSGMKDDVYLGMVGGVAHMAMKDEAILNQEATASIGGKKTIDYINMNKKLPGTGAKTVVNNITKMPNMTTIVQIENKTNQDVSAQILEEHFTRNERGELEKTVNLVLQGMDENTNGLRDIIRGG